MVTFVRRCFRDDKNEFAVPGNNQLAIFRYDLKRLTIMRTCPCNVHPLTSHLYIVKLGFIGVYFFSYFSSKT